MTFYNGKFYAGERVANSTIIPTIKVSTDGYTWNNYNFQQSSLMKGTVNYIYGTSDGMLFATATGLVRDNGTSTTKLFNEGSLSIYQDNGILLLGTSAGIRYSTDNG